MTTHILLKIGEEFFPIKVGGKDPLEGRYENKSARDAAKRAENNLRRLHKQVAKTCDPAIQSKIDDEVEALKKAKQGEKREVVKDIKLAYMAWIPKYVAAKLPPGTTTVKLKFPDRIETVQLRKTNKGYLVKNPRTGAYSVFFVGQPFSKLTDEEIWDLTTEATSMIEKKYPPSACKV